MTRWSEFQTSLSLSFPVSSSFLKLCFIPEFYPIWALPQNSACGLTIHPCRITQGCGVREEGSCSTLPLTEGVGRVGNKVSLVERGYKFHILLGYKTAERLIFFWWHEMPLASKWLYPSAHIKILFTGEPVVLNPCCTLESVGTVTKKQTKQCPPSPLCPLSLPQLNKGLWEWGLSITIFESSFGGCKSTAGVKDHRLDQMCTLSASTQSLSVCLFQNAPSSSDSQWVGLRGPAEDSSRSWKLTSELCIVTGFSF